MAITGTLALFHSWEILETRAFVSYSPPGLGFRRGFSFWCPSLSRRSPETRRWITGAQSLPRLVEEFDPKVPIEEAVTPPSSWYTEPSFLALELDHVFSRGWLAAGFTEQIKNPHDFFTGSLGNVEFVICRDASGCLRAFHNVCRHHASLLASGSGQKSCFVCPYHGWTYGLDGVLLKATRISGIKNFHKDDFGLIPLKVATWGPFVLISLEKDCLHQQNRTKETVENEWLGHASEILSTGGIDSSLKHVCRREYTIQCNWKVFCDNYLDGGYHVPYAHGGLASGLNLNSYSTHIFEKVSVQRCESTSVDTNDYDRLGSKALYAFIYPNFMINRYGPWMDTNLVLPLGPTKCQVIFDYFLDASLVDNKKFIEESLKQSEQVQIEDIILCEGVQRGLESPAYTNGRYAPSVEMAMHHFHLLLHQSLNKF
ncbi:choline monooxygenase, chloroplastic [Dioscorea cayenensis subsp. rotundata]|uniref:Choline monooxygenase, chloroplastic n=1 Tax=Dioscorea cayennensis subsp. rotundata TaxID=55577 RepID=A0AB40AWE1_DIOCR|nr:choline monooxygenase, chloroplastic [Dioscorea cayenensis subsp. rotundata]